MPESDELRQRYETAVRIVRAERQDRQKEYATDPVTCAAKLAEMDKLLETLLWLKDELKPYCAPAPEQQSLIDVPAKGGGYN